jgi:hypothetical protein
MPATATATAKRMPATWADVSPGQTVYIDNYEGGRFPQANPRTSGPYVVVSTTRRLLRHANPSKHQAPFMHYPGNLLAGPS